MSAFQEDRIFSGKKKNLMEAFREWSEGREPQEGDWVFEKEALSLRQMDNAALLKECLKTLRHSRVFIGSKEKMHPTGRGLYDALVQEIERRMV